MENMKNMEDMVHIHIMEDTKEKEGELQSGAKADLVLVAVR